MLERKYFPCFSTRAFEFMAYSRCSNSVKDSILPVITLTRQKLAESFSDTFDLVSDAAEGRPIILDFDTTPRVVTSAEEAAAIRRQKAAKREALDGKKPRERTEKELARYAELRRRTEQFNAHLRGFLEPRHGAAAWIAMAGAHSGVVPVVRLTSMEAVNGQIAVANQNIYPVAFRIDPENPEEVAMAGAGIAALHNPGSSYLLLDSGFVRNRASSSAAATEAALQQLKNSAGEAFGVSRKVVISGSFPASSLRELPRLLQMEERLHHDSISGSWSVEYGDHASLPKKSNRKGGNGWFPHVDLTLDRHWRVELEERNSDPTGYVRCAKKTVNSDDWKRRTQCWGTSVIEEVSAGTTTIDKTKFVVPGPWIAVRANQHISRHAAYK
ncbi:MULTISPECIES: beta family protein [unclassified Mesorhizobium]|uniref:beta family protein n=1 Tax=unclassified Mesorhizobium TaxID=325217 RepID=UPI00301576E9